MKVTFLGTGTSQGVPVIACGCEVCRSQDPRDQRLRCSILIENQGKQIVIDTGPDFRQQMLRAQVAQLDAVVYTHAHKDHVAGMDDIRAFNFKQKKAIDLYATAEVQLALKREFSYVFAEHKYPGIPEVSLHTIGEEDFVAADTRFTPVQVWHHQMPVKAFVFGKFGYVTDANFIPEVEKDKLRELDVLVLNALRKESHISHFNLDQALALIEELNPKAAYLTHLSHQFGLHEQESAQLPSRVHLAYDGLSIDC